MSKRHVFVRDELRDAVIEECARELETSYPDHVWLNAACAALRSMKSTSQPAGDVGNSLPSGASSQPADSAGGRTGGSK